MLQFPLTIDVAQLLDVPASDQDKWRASVASPDLPRCQYGATKEHALGALFLALSEYPGFHLWTFNIRVHAVQPPFIPPALPRVYSEGLPTPSNFEMDTFRESGKIPAIKAYRERTGLGLKEAKDAIEIEAAKQGL